MKNKGFTLTEVLITLGIIGVVAALTIPQLYNSTRNAHIGAQYATAISTLESGIGLYLYDNNVRSLAQLSGGSPTPAALLTALAGKYIKMEAVQTGEVKATLPCSGGSYTLPDQSVIGACGSAAIASTPSANSELYFLSSQSKKQDALIEGLDYFRMSVTSDGHIYVPGKDYDTANATCSELSGGKACAGRVAMNGWKFDKKIFD